MSEWVFVRYPLTAVGCRGYFAIGVYLSPIATACGEYNYPAPPAQVCRLGLPFKQSSFIPHSQRFTLPFSSGSIVSQLTTLPICYTPHWVSPPDKSVDDRVICTSLRNTFSYCRATGRIPNGPRAALAYAAALPGAQYNLEHCNTITNSAGRRVWGFMGIEAVARPHINEFTDASQCTYVPEDWRD